MTEKRKAAEAEILRIVQTFEAESGVKVNWITISRSNHVGFSHDGARPAKNPPATRAAMKGEIK